MLSKVQMAKVCTDTYSVAKSMMTLFSWLYKFTSSPFAYVSVHTSTAQIYSQICVLASYVPCLEIACIPAVNNVKKNSCIT
jgi:hypothetical protein